ncbi:MAG: tRNA (N(6)-L-threonylcarbamoyladenosine(37)-C(2))-methylthiotransferase MtaB [Spirochaetales bacterium]|nr:tRNA (N(6)-L-threonylcarbamoyladenosine(37)-C(2))-methylthiotransferase MtaB [Spirochaetales bacterium]
MRIAFYTLGCKLNQCESEALATAAACRGFSLSVTWEEADIYIINTCTVTSKAEQKARRVIRKILRERPAAQVVVTGCYAQLESEALRGISPRLIIVTQEEKDLLLDLLSSAAPGGDLQLLVQDLRDQRLNHADPFAFRVDSTAYHTRPFLKIQDGCDNRCAYCRVPLARGNSISLKADEVLRRLEDLEEKGFREVVLTGVNITAYRDGDTTFDDLLERLLSRNWSFRIRLSSLEPDRVTEHLAELVTDERICPHFHLPVQSLSDRILKAMGRHYDAAGALKAVERLTASRSDPFLAADVITGFPGETEEDSQETFRLLTDLPFSGLHVFPFSPRPGTRAFGMKNRVPERDSGQRSARLLRLSKELHEAYLHRWIGRVVSPLLLEKGSAPGRWQGLSENYLQLSVRGVPAKEAAPGLLCRAEVVEEAGTMAARFSGF